MNHMEQGLTGYRNPLCESCKTNQTRHQISNIQFRVVGDVLHQRSSASKRALARGAYQLRFAESREDVEAAFRLRFLVFNLELNEGLESAYETGYDTDEFDKTCDHLIVEHRPSRHVVGTYRLQTGRIAARNVGYYSEREFDFSPYEPIRNSLVELGRASIHRDHRSFEVLTLLWRGIASYALQRNARYLVGCSSLTSQCPQEGSDMYWRLKEFLVEPVFRTSPRPRFTIPISAAIPEMRCINPPRLLRAYLSIGAQICGEPAMDREFKTIDFLTLLDLTKLCPSARFRFLRNE
jgi:putative hemolysin